MRVPPQNCTTILDSDADDLSRLWIARIPACGTQASCLLFPLWRPVAALDCTHPCMRYAGILPALSLVATCRGFGLHASLHAVRRHLACSFACGDLSPLWIARSFACCLW